jgi:hypothetical protein
LKEDIHAILLLLDNLEIIPAICTGMIKNLAIPAKPVAMAKFLILDIIDI